jgi:hypothetical protein
MLSDAEKSFIDKRRQLVRFWPYIGSGILAFLATFIIWLVVTKPLLANPFFVLSEINRGTIDQPMMALLAGMLPIAVWAALITCIAAVTFAFVACSNERKYLAIIERCGDA